VALIDDRLFVVSFDGATVAVTDDLSTWTVSELPDAIPAIDQTIYTLKPNKVTALYKDDDGLVLVELQALRREDGRQVDVARQLYSWRSTDDGVTWELQPLARPTTLAADEIGGLGHTPDSGFFYLGLADEQLVLLPVEAGELVPWGECEPAAGADCRFVEIDGLDATDLDLTGIDFTGAALTDARFEDSNLSGAILRGAELFTADGAQWGDVDLTGADLTNAYLGGMNLAGADLTNATLTNAYVPPSLLRATLTGAVFGDTVVNFFQGEDANNASLAGLVLTDVRFYGAIGGSGMKGVDFSGATLDGVRFTDIDLTGANFTGVIFGEGDATFGSGVICPDGAPPTAEVYDHTACRI